MTNPSEAELLRRTIALLKRGGLELPADVAKWWTEDQKARAREACGVASREVELLAERRAKIQKLGGVAGETLQADIERAVKRERACKEYLDAIVRSGATGATIQPPEGM